MGALGKIKWRSRHELNESSSLKQSFESHDMSISKQKLPHFEPATKC